jgi:NADH-quinone oxidoreductase subunit J
MERRTPRWPAVIDRRYRRQAEQNEKLTMDALFFWLFSAGMIGFGLAVILNRNPVASALSFAFSIVFMAGLFVQLSAFFLAAVQILVTAGAVMVLFLFIIMLLNPEAMEHAPRRKLWMAAALVLGLGFVALVARTLPELPRGAIRLADLAPAGTTPPRHYMMAPPPPSFATDEQSRADFGDDTHRIGHLLFTRYVAPFEITSLLILVATIGVIVICKEDEPPRPDPRELITREAPPRPERERQTAGVR